MLSHPLSVINEMLGEVPKNMLDSLASAQQTLLEKTQESELQCPTYLYFP